MDATCLEQTTVVNVSLFIHTHVRSVLIAQNDDLIMAGHKIGTSINHKDTKAIIVFGCSKKARIFINHKPFLEALQSEFEGIIIRETVHRPSDTASPVWGKEFSCILPVTDHNGALKLAEEIRIGVEKLCSPHSGSQAADYVTVSLGVLTIECNEDTLPHKIVKTCDELLYQAKKQGRNKVVGSNHHKIDGSRL